ncbi:MAG: rRNA maturation RNase YbeY [Rhizobiales bacterium]|nr:rRNA maturation RNase YbeY [Hyphomicrobiales bacterium]
MSDPSRDRECRAGGSAGLQLEVDVIGEHEPWLAFADLTAALDAAARVAIEFAAADGQRALSAWLTGRRAGVTILLCDDATMADLNGRFRGKPSPTNVLSFPGAPDASHLPPGEVFGLGDVALGYETVVAEAAGLGRSLRDHAMHLAVHGTLHLLGYDHEDDGEADRMEEIEIRVLAELGVANPYESDAVVESAG